MEKIVYVKSFYAKLVLERGLALDAYQKINEVLDSYNASKRLSFDHATSSFDGNNLCLFRVSRKNMYLYLNQKTSKVSKYGFEATGSAKAYKNYESVLVIDTEKALKNAVAALKLTLEGFNAKESSGTVIDYQSDLYERSFDVLLSQKYIKKYIRKINENNEEELEEVEETLYKVTFNAKLLYNACNKADTLFIVTNYNNWSLADSIPMLKVSDNEFTAFAYYPENTKLEFKICKTLNWSGVEKGIWNEEIVNHNYIVVNSDIVVEDLIHNFR